ncbi:aminoglycoside phosphotransferase family protein [Jiangella gansuensis]|uniref:aminoglycoside phosphotransferase family protein n=1 Tax=Jiangella gansuensis TaxID=281473 RepID=UPI00047D5F52|nr:aminoglycoside phosphotransferase family protein [Jiangella gansuensis]
MLTAADRELADRDGVIPGLPVLLDPDALTAWLAGHWAAGHSGDRPPPQAVVVRYVRYKPGTGMVAGVELHWPTGRRPGLVKAVASRAAPKLAKLPLADHELLLGYADAGRDRRLPALRGLLTGQAGEPVTLRYKPERRWVGLAPGQVVKVHRPPLADTVTDQHRVLVAAGLPVPELLTVRPRAGLLTYRWVDGEPLDRLPAAPERLVAAGELLRRLHGMDVGPGGMITPPGPVTPSGLAGAVRAVGAVQPALRPDAQAVARIVAAVLTGSHRPRTLVHGDFSADQVVAGAEGLAVIDLDRLAVDDPATDLAGWAAAEIVAGRAATDARAVDVLGPLLDGYRPAPSMLARLDALTAAALLRRATEPFRGRLGGWPELVAEHVVRAGRLAVAR